MRYYFLLYSICCFGILTIPSTNILPEWSGIKRCKAFWIWACFWNCKFVSSHFQSHFGHIGCQDGHQELFMYWSHIGRALRILVCLFVLHQRCRQFYWVFLHIAVLGRICWSVSDLFCNWNSHGCLSWEGISTMILSDVKFNIM